MARATKLVLLHGGSDYRRIVAHVEHVTGEPMVAQSVRLITRWGSLALAGDPRLETVVECPETVAFMGHMDSLGVHTSHVTQQGSPTADEVVAARAVLDEARASGYRLPVSTVERMPNEGVGTR
jgi:hypothetical protein